MSIPQTLLDHVHHCFVGGFRLPVGLRMSWCGKGKLYAPVPAEVYEVMAGELGSVVSDDFLGSRIE